MGASSSAGLGAGADFLKKLNIWAAFSLALCALMLDRLEGLLSGPMRTARQSAQGT
jgi:hypothetical protein